MTFYADTDVECSFPFDFKKIGQEVAQEVLQKEECPYEVQVNFLLTDDEGIHEMNRRFRGIDRPTDVLSFPNIAYHTPADFSEAESEFADCFDPDSGELIMGDIVISQPRVYAQAEEYGHSLLREFAFLVAHSMLHLCGYDHESPGDAQEMERRQEEALSALHITREGSQS